MPGIFDIDQYRAARKAVSRHQSVVSNDVIEHLANRENITLWREGIVRPNLEAGSDAYSHFHGFRNAIIDRAAREASSDESIRFLANDFEQILDPQKVQDFVNGVDLSEPLDAKLERRAADFFREQAATLVRARPGSARP